MPHTVKKLKLMMFRERIYHFIKTLLSFAYQQWLWVILERILLEFFTGSLCSKLLPASLHILWCKMLFFKASISVVFSTVFLKKIENHKFSYFFSFLVLKMSQIFVNGSTTTKVKVTIGNYVVYFGVLDGKHKT